mmetsp:Transcript_3699/g.5469  ORF Transcript_3699/g.5469 Transcript_3699/m.5469 type:complete len:125 (-) Transcript_3699:675-1049(-)
MNDRLARYHDASITEKSFHVEAKKDSEENIIITLTNLSLKNAHAKIVVNGSQYYSPNDDRGLFWLQPAKEEIPYKKQIVLNHKLLRSKEGTYFITVNFASIIYINPVFNTVGTVTPRFEKKLQI